MLEVCANSNHSNSQSESFKGFFDLFYTRMFIRNAVPLFGNITDNPRSYFPLTKKDIENV